MVSAGAADRAEPTSMCNILDKLKADAEEVKEKAVMNMGS